MQFSEMTNEEKKEFLLKEYVENKNSLNVCADMVGTYAIKLRRFAKKHGIELRDRSTATKLALEGGTLKHPTKGRKRTDEEKRTIAKSLIDNWNNMSDEELEAAKEQRREQWNNLSAEKKQSIHDAAITALRQTATDGSKVEKYFAKWLQRDGYLVDFHKKNIIAGRELELDIYLPKQHVAIEVDGPSHYIPIFSDEKLLKQRKFDMEKNAILANARVRLIRVKYMTKTNSKFRIEEAYKKTLEFINSKENFTEIEV